MHSRAARPEDYEAFTRFWVDLGIDSPTPPIEDWIEHLMPQTVFLEEDGVLAAYSLSFPFGARGDVRQIVVGSGFRKRGVGRQLMATVATKLRAAGCTDWRLETMANNAAALALYASVGMRVLCTIEIVHMDRAARTRFAQLRSGSCDTTRVVACDDAGLEANLDLGAGQIARWRRARGASPLHRVETRALAQDWRDHSPERALMFPFLAFDIDAAAALVAETLDGPEDYELCVVDPIVHTALVASGARQVEQQLQLAGAIPVLTGV